MKATCRIIYFAVLCVITFCSAELASRIDDLIHEDIPLLSSPSAERDLKITTEFGTRGRPDGHYKKWHLNEWGFRGPSITQRPHNDTVRVMVLGASEAFGLYEAPQREFPAQLAAFLHQHGEYEVVNAAVAGMTLATIIPYWISWCSQFQPRIVVIYASPLFYLADYKPQVIHGPFPVPAQRTAPMRSRYLDRLRDVVSIPDVFQKMRDERSIVARTAGKSADWLFQEIPIERINAYVSQLEQLGLLIEQKRALVVLCTHATSISPPFTVDQLFEFERGRVNIPRATAQVAADFHTLANERIRRLAVDHGWSLADADAEMSGHANLFGDLVHFTDGGSEVIANLIARQIIETPPVAASSNVEGIAFPNAAVSSK